MKVLVMGCGSIGLRHLKNLLVNNDFIPAAFDVNRDSEKAVKEISGGIRFFNSLEESAAWKPEMVIVATPNMYHCENTLWAIDNGAHVLCEKPLAVTMDEGRKMVGAARSADKKLGVGFTERFREGIEFIENEVRNKSLGTLIGGRAMVGTYNTLLCAKDPSHRAESFGSLILDYTHELDVLSSVFGSVKRLECFSNKLARKELKANPSLAAALLEYEGGEVVSIHFDYVQHPQRRVIEFYGDRKSLVFNWQDNYIELYDCDKKSVEVFRFQTVRDEQFVREQKDMFDAVRLDREPRITGEDGMKSLDVAARLIDKLRGGDAE